MRVTKQERQFPDVDFTKPVKDMKIAENDCLGKEWDPYDKACTYCAECDLCGLLYQQPHSKKVKAIEDAEKENGTPFLDTAHDIHTLDFFDRFKKIVLKSIEEKNPVTKDEVFDMFLEKYNISDEMVVFNWVKKFLEDNKEIKLSKGEFVLR